MKRKDWLVIVILLISPILINYIILGKSLGLTVNGSIDGWLGFYGAFVGAVIPMFILYRTRMWNKEDNEEIRKSQNKILQYQAKKEWFDGLRKQLDDNYRILDFQGTIVAANEMALGNYQGAIVRLMLLNKNIEMQGYSFDLYFSGEYKKKEEVAYSDCYNDILREYGGFVNDLILICRLMKEIEQGNEVESYIVNSIREFNKLHIKNNIIIISDFLKELESLANSNLLQSELENVCMRRISEVSMIHSEKEKLVKVTNDLLKFEDKEIERILQ